MCTKFVINELRLGNRMLGYELFNGKEIIEMTPANVKSELKSGKEIKGLVLNSNGEVELDRAGYGMNNIMVKSHIGNLRSKFETESLANIMYMVVGKKEEADGFLYEVLSSRFEHTWFNENKMSALNEIGAIQGGYVVYEKKQEEDKPVEEVAEECKEDTQSQQEEHEGDSVVENVDVEETFSLEENVCETSLEGQESKEVEDTDSKKKKTSKRR